MHCWTTATEVTWTGHSTKSSSDQSINLWVLQDTRQWIIFMRQWHSTRRYQNHCLCKFNHRAVSCVTNPFLALSYCIGGIAIGSHGKGMSVGMNGSKWKSIKIIITWNLIVFVGGNLEIKRQLVLDSFFSCNRYLLLPSVTKSKKIIKI